MSSTTLLARRDKPSRVGRRRWGTGRVVVARSVSQAGAITIKIDPRSSPLGQSSGAVVIQATKDFTVQTVQKAANRAVQAGSRLCTDSASSYRALKGYIHEYVNHTQKEYTRGDVHENRAECLFSILKPYLRVFRGISKYNLPGYVGFFQFLRNFRQLNACEQAELILQAALDPVIASRVKKGEFVQCFDHFDLLQTARN
jgi:ISXO2 transposase-like protein